MSSIVFDIETGPLAPEWVERFWNPADVKLGNLKDSGKIQEKVEEARQDFLAKAPLSPLTGKVLAIGYRYRGEIWIDGRDERPMLAEFWSAVNKQIAEGNWLVGHNIFGFDLPFLVRRSWVHGVAVPAVIERDRYWASCFVDTMAHWTCGKYGEFIKLGVLSQLFGLGTKPPGIDGADFHRLWNGTPDERRQAEAYLRNDLDLTWGVAMRMGIAS